MEQLEVLEWAMIAISRLIQETEDGEEKEELQKKLRSLARLSVREELRRGQLVRTDPKSPYRGFQTPLRLLEGFG